MNDIVTALEEAGLTSSETKVYMSLLRHGSLTKGPLVKHAMIAPSKIYEVADKLRAKGLISTVERDGVRVFTAAPPIKIREYLEQKKEHIQEAADGIQHILPRLLSLRKAENEPEIALFSGWNGMTSVFMALADRVTSGDEIVVVGASPGEEVEQTVRFFLKYTNSVHSKGAGFRILFNVSARNYVAEFEKKMTKTFSKRFLFEKTITEVTVYKDTVLILSLEQDPYVIRIVNPKTAHSFLQYFEVLWQTAVP